MKALKVIGISLSLMVVGFLLIGIVGTPHASSSPTAPQPTPIPPATQKFKGAGKSVVGPIELRSGLAVIGMAHNGKANFIVHLLDSTGQPTDYLANQIGAWAGQKAIKINKAGTYLIDITADGGWMLNITQ